MLSKFKFYLNSLNSVYVKYQKETKTFIIKGNGRIDDDYWFIFKNILMVGFNNTKYTIKVKDNKVLFPEDSSSLFAHLEVNFIFPIDLNLTGVVATTFMFASCTNFNENVSKWDVSSVKEMEGMFYGCENLIADISNWNISDETTVDSMLCGVKDFNTQDSTLVERMVRGLD